MDAYQQRATVKPSFNKYAQDPSRSNELEPQLVSSVVARMNSAPMITYGPSSVNRLTSSEDYVMMDASQQRDLFRPKWNRMIQATSSTAYGVPEEFSVSELGFAAYVDIDAKSPMPKIRHSGKDRIQQRRTL
jgi:hypothetical protein